VILLAASSISLHAQESVGPYPIYRTIGTADGLPYQTATSTLQDEDGTYWIGCPVGVQRFVLGAPVKLYRFGDTLAPQSERWVYQLQQDGDSLFAYTGSEVHFFDRQLDRWRPAHWKRSLQAQSNETTLNQLPLRTSVSGYQRIPLSLKQDLPELTNASILRYSETRAFLGTPNGLYEVRQNRSGVWRSVSGNKPLGLEGFPIEGLGIDQHGNLLIGTSMASVVVLHHLVLKNQWLTLPEGANVGAWGMSTSRDGELYVSTRKAVSSVDVTTGFQLEHDAPLNIPQGSRINDLSFQERDLFVGSSSGLFRFQNVEENGLPISGKLVDPAFVFRIDSVGVDKLDVYAAGGIYHLAADGSKQYATGAKEKGAQFYDGLRAADGSFWAAGVSGLLRAARFGESLTTVLPINGEQGINFPVLRILNASNGNLYFACLDGGLWRTEDGRSLHRVEGKGQLQRSIYSAEIDVKDRIWMGTNKGLACFDPKDEQWSYFTLESGYPISDHNQGSSKVLPDSRLVFGGGNGLLIFDTDSLLARRRLPKIAMTGLSLDDVEQPKSWPFPQEIAYGHEQRRLDLSFALLGALDTVGLVPEVRLLGKSEQWRTLRGMRLDLDDLSYGIYTLETRVRHRQSGQVGLVSSAVIQRPPPWYATWWARGLGAIGVLGLVAFVWSRIVTLRLRRKLEKMQLENRINAERVRIGRDLHDNVGSTLTYLTTSLRRLKEQVDEENQTKIVDLQELSQDTLWQLRETIWAANHRQVSLGEFSERLGSYLRRIRTVAQPAELRAILPTEANIELAPGQGLYLFRIVQEALTNAIKYASAKQILVKLEHSTDALTLEVSDDGAGFDESRMAYSSGVASIRERASEMGADVSLTTGIGRGTKWVVRFPLAEQKKSKS